MRWYRKRPVFMINKCQLPAISLDHIATAANGRFPPFGPNGQGFAGRLKADYRPRTLFSVLLPSYPLSITLPTFDVDPVVATQCPVESQSLGPVQKMGKAIDLIVVTPAWKGLKLSFERRQPGRVCRQVHLALFDRTARGLEPGFLVLVRSNAFIAPAVITKKLVQKRFARSGILDQNSIRFPTADKLQRLCFGAVRLIRTSLSLPRKRRTYPEQS